jgi:Domain of unknown function (DUF1707)
VTVMDTTGKDDRTYAAGDLRVSDADRDRVLAELSEHFQAGRLTTAELEDRTGRALSARTGNDLAVLLTDLPPAPGTGAPAPARRPGRHVAPALWICLALCVSAVVSVVGDSHHVHIVLVPWWLIVVAIFVLRRRIRWR